ncbi:MAG: phosphatidylserine decarboxylase, partial [Candidatus Adiutrix sp.]
MLNDFFKTKDPSLNINNHLPLARPGFPFILMAFLAFLIFLLVGWHLIYTFFLALTIFVGWFFRDPARPTPPMGFGLSPADGRIIRIETLDENPYTGRPAKKISIFMNVLNVHVNRVPVSGRLVSQTYFPGAFFNASLDKASLNNERNAVVIETEEGPIAMVQIAGLVARRIVSWVSEGDDLSRGQRFGMIRFG